MTTRAFARNTARRLFTEHGLTGWRIDFDRAKTRYGQCQYAKRTISLSAPLIAARTEAEVEQTIIHEVAHALTEGHGHDRVWLAKARSMGFTGSVKRPMDEGTRAAMVAQARWVGTCGGCGVQFPRHRAPAPGGKYRHKGCRGTITFATNPAA